MKVSWIKRLGRPLCPSRAEAEQYLTSQLEQAVPPGWTVERIEGPRPAWRIARDEIPNGEWPNQEYGIELSAGLDLVVFTHGNNDVGPFELHHALQKALVIDSSALRAFGMAACIRHLLAECRPNEWGYT
jgi:hypothetical protein